MLLIDEVDRADEEFEAFLLELLSDFAVTVPEIGTLRATRPPRVILTSNRTREIHLPAGLHPAATENSSASPDFEATLPEF